MNLVVMVVTYSTLTAGAGYVGLYKDMAQCTQMQEIYQRHVDAGAVMECTTVVRLQQVPIPPPRPEGLVKPRQPVLIPPPRPTTLSAP